MTEGRTAYVAPSETENLLSESLLHVDMAADAPPSTTPAPERLHCKRGRRRVILRGEDRCRKLHRRKHRHARHSPR